MAPPPETALCLLSVGEPHTAGGGGAAGELHACSGGG